MTKNIVALSFAGLLLAGAAPALGDEIGCDGVFNEHTTLADVEAAFGKDNVVTGEVPGAEGMTFIATTVFPGDAEREMQVRWWDEENRTNFAGVTLAKADTGPFGLKVGMSIDEVEAINGQPFELWGFYWDYGGGAGFETGTLSQAPGGCFINLRFTPMEENLSEAVMTAISGDIMLMSDMPELDTAKVVLSEINLGYAYPEEMMPAE